MTKQETILREAIRKEIRKELIEAGFLKRAKKYVTQKVGALDKLAQMKMLKRAIGTGSADQKAAGLLQIVQAVLGQDKDKDAVLLKLKQRMAQGSVRAEI
jgi:hypothetical protein